MSLPAGRSTIAHPAFGGTVSALVINHLQMPGSDTEMIPVAYAAGQVLAAGTIMGRISATSEYVQCHATATDGSQVPRGVIMEDLDTTLGGQTFALAVRGVFNPTALIYGTGHTEDTVRLPLMDQRIYLQTPRYSYE